MKSAEPSHWDLIVVGTGPGGAAVAREMARAGRRVLMLEWGQGGPVRGTFAQYARELLVPGKSLLISPELLGTVGDGRGCAGSSTCASATPGTASGRISRG